MKKAVSVLLVCSMLSTAAAYAKDIEISSEKEKITVKAQIEPLTSGLLIASKRGADINDNDNLYAVLEKEADDNGNLVFTFNMPQERNGESTDGQYEVRVKQDGADVLVGNFEYATEQSKVDLLEKIKSAANAEEIKQIITDDANEITLKSMRFGFDAYKSLSDASKLEVAETVLQKMTSSMSEEEVKELFNRTTAVVGINANGDIETFMETANFSDGDIRYESITDATRRTQTCEYIASNIPYKDIDALEKAYLQVSALYTINTARFDQIEGLFAKYSTILELDNDSNYASYKKANNKSEINKALLNMIKKSMPKTIAQLSSYLGTVVNDNKKSTGGSGGGSSSSNGGSSSSSIKGTTTGNITVGPAPEQAEQPKAVFDDINDYAWATEAVTALAKAKVITGDGTGNFNGNKEMTREEFVTMLVKATGLYDSVAICRRFTDVNESDWFYPAVASAFNRQLVNGIEEHLFGSGQKLTRQDLVTLSARAAENLPDYEKAHKTFDDDADIADYAKEAVYDLYMRGVVNGVDENHFAPKAYATKAQGAQLIYALFYKN